jgi:hypothetical protein
MAANPKMPKTQVQKFHGMARKLEAAAASLIR